jgi:uncharacterized cupin superfamily protein
MLEGEAVLVEDHETVLRAGDAAAWAPGARVGHCLENRSENVVVYLIVGTRAARGTVHYPDHDVVFHHDDEGTRRFTRSDGAPIDVAPRRP